MLFFKVLIFASHGPDGHVSLNTSYDEDAAVFFLELLLKIVIQNRFVFYDLFNFFFYYTWL